MVRSALAVSQTEMRLRGTRATLGRLDLPSVIAQNVRCVRLRRGYSLEKLGELSGVSRSMLCQIENGKSVPTVVLLWKIAQALEVKLDALLSAKAVASISACRAGQQAREVQFNWRSFVSGGGGNGVEVLELRLSSTQLLVMQPRNRESLANVVVSAGKIAVALGDGRTARLQRGDALTFEAHVPHSFQNLQTDPAILYIVVTRR